jgi:hypothetical protein
LPRTPGRGFLAAARDYVAASDRSLISRQVASKKVEEPLRRFYAATPPADLPADVC